jgi:hypothetical protein
MWVSEKAAQAFVVAWCPPCAMGQAKFKFWAGIVLVLGQIQLSNFLLRFTYFLFFFCEKSGN